MSILAMTVLSIAASAFCAREHSAIAFIAERYLTPKARAAVSEITGGQKISLYASFPDKFRADFIIDGHALPHSFHVDADFVPDMEAATSCLGMINLASEALSNGRYKTMDKDSSLLYLTYIIHFVGDMHCPSHVKYPRDIKPESPDSYVIAGNKLKFHKSWDEGFSIYSLIGGPLELSKLADIASKAQRKEYQKGSVKDWGMDVARLCFEPTRSDSFDAEKVAALHNFASQAHGEFVKDEIMRAGYRLAAVLNATFK